MPGRGPAPKEARAGRHKPIRGEWKASPGVGWQHGPIPKPDIPLFPLSLQVWDAWMKSWFASNWTPADLPGLNVAIGLYNQVIDYLREPLIEKEYVTTKGETRTVWVAKPNPAPELRQVMDNYGITPKGQQDRRWTRPKSDDSETVRETTVTDNPYAGLRVVKSA